MGVELAMDQNIEFRPVRCLLEVSGGALRFLLQAEGKGVQAIGYAPGPGVVRVDDHTAVGGHQLRKAPEGAFDVVQVLEEVQMVLLHVEDDSHRGGEGQEGVAVFAGLGNDGVPAPHPVARA